MTLLLMWAKASGTAQRSISRAPGTVLSDRRALRCSLVIQASGL